MYISSFASIVKYFISHSVVFGEVAQTNKDYMRDVTAINADWLHELAPHFYEVGTDRELAAKRARTDDG